jgi:hypothetical protein
MVFHFHTQGYWANITFCDKRRYKVKIYFSHFQASQKCFDGLEQKRAFVAIIVIFSKNLVEAASSSCKRLAASCKSYRARVLVIAWRSNQIGKIAPNYSFQKEGQFAPTGLQLVASGSQLNRNHLPKKEIIQD